MFSSSNWVYFIVPALLQPLLAHSKKFTIRNVPNKCRNRYAKNLESAAEVYRVNTVHTILPVYRSLCYPWLSGRMAKIPRWEYLLWSHLGKEELVRCSGHVQKSRCWVSQCSSRVSDVFAEITPFLSPRKVYKILNFQKTLSKPKIFNLYLSTRLYQQTWMDGWHVFWYCTNMFANNPRPLYNLFIVGRFQIQYMY